MIAPPGTPAPIVEVLTKAYLETVSSKEYIEEATKRGFELGTAPLVLEEVEQHQPGLARRLMGDFVGLDRFFERRLERLDEKLDAFIKEAKNAQCK